MKTILYLSLFTTILLYSCSPNHKNLPASSFENDLLALKEYFHIPGMAAIVTRNNEVIFENYYGFSDLENNTPVDSTTIFPIASITKTFASTLIMQYVEAGKIDLDTPINNYLDESDLSDSIKIRHILSHTSEGEPGSFFNYSPRFSMLTPVLEKVSGMSFDQLLKKNILNPLALSHTVPVLNQAVIDSLEGRFAKPYYFFGEVENGHFDTGLSTSSGLASTVKDIATFANALSTDKIISDKSFERLSTPFEITHGKSPYGYGIFSQEFLGKKLIWGYGQEDCFSSLVLIIPEDNLTLTLLANNNLMSDPPRLINGDITYSLFALSFLKHHVFELPHYFEMKDWENPETLNTDLFAGEFSSLYRQELLANAIAASFMSQGYSDELERCAQLSRIALKSFPNYTEYGNLSLMRVLNVLTESNPEEFGGYIEKLGLSLLNEYEYNPYANIYLAYYYQAIKEGDKASEYFKKIAEAPNFRAFWYTIESLDFLGRYYKEKNPEQAKKYFQRIVDIDWNMNGVVERAKKELEML